MGIHHNVLHVIIREEIVPHVSTEDECIVEDKLQTRLLGLDHLSDVPVEVLQNGKVRVPPWLIDWLDGVESCVVTPLVEETLNGVLGPINGISVDANI